MLCYNIWNNTSTDNILHQPSPLGNWTPPDCDHESLQMYLFPISFIAQFIISALRAVLLIPGPHFPVPYLSLIRLVIPGLGWDELDQHLNPFLGLLCKHEAFFHEKCIVCCLSEMNWLTLYLDTRGVECGHPSLCKHEVWINFELREKCIQITGSWGVCEYRGEMERLSEIGYQYVNAFKVHRFAYWHLTLGMQF